MEEVKKFFNNIGDSLSSRNETSLKISEARHILNFAIDKSAYQHILAIQRMSDESIIGIDLMVKSANRSLGQNRRYRVNHA